MQLTLVQGPSGLIARKVAAGDEDRAALRREAEVLQLAAHPGVVRLVDVTSTTLDTAAVGHRTLATSRPATPKASAAFAASVADILADLHRAGIVHGAVEPSHILIDDAGRPVLCGWRRGGRVGEPVGGPLATADANPPMLRPSRDVFGLGRLLGFLLDDVPDALGLQRVIESATATDPDARPSAAAVAAAIRDALTTDRDRHQGGARHPVASRPDPAAVAAHRAPHRRSRSASRLPVLVGSGVVALLVAGGFLPWRGDADARLEPAPMDRSIAGPDGGATPPAALSGSSLPAPTDQPTPTPPAGPDVVPDTLTCESVLIPTTPPFPALACTRSSPLPTEGLDAGGLRYAIGEPGDEILVVDLGCSGHPAVALVRPATGLVAMFPGWASPGADLQAELRRPLPPGSHLETTAAGPGGCPDLVGRTPDDAVVPILSAQPQRTSDEPRPR